MTKPLVKTGIICLLLCFGPAQACVMDWGFFGHRRINRLAVFTLPPEMIVFFKRHIGYITDHSVDPDKRRYATRHEAVRHYIDLDIWGTMPFDGLPRKWTDALVVHSDLLAVNEQGDTSYLYKAGSHVFGSDSIQLRLTRSSTVPVAYDTYRRFFQTRVEPQYYEDTWSVSPEDIAGDLALPAGSLRKIRQIILVDRFSEHGILPYHLAAMQRRLTDAFRRMDAQAILRHATDMGHYIGDGHVPLHTTKNYNGQLSNQDGIHAFWESRLPELYADAEYDYFVGKAIYITDPGPYYWDIVLRSHELVDSVLQIEKEVKARFPEDRHFCFDERLGTVVRTQCREFAEAYHQALSGQVEARFRAAVAAVGNAWYTAWVDAGQPDLGKLLDKSELSEALSREAEQEAESLKGGEPKGRPHEN